MLRCQDLHVTLIDVKKMMQSHKQNLQEILPVSFSFLEYRYLVILNR